MDPRALHIVGHGRMAVALRNTCAARFERVATLRGRELVEGASLRRGARGITLVLAVPDRVVEACARAVAPSLRAGDVVLHLAGMLGPEVLADARRAGASVGSLHPLAAVSSPSRSATLHGRAFLFEGDRAAQTEATRMLAGSTVLSARRVHRARYHAAAALVATGAVAIAQGASAVFAESTTPRRRDGELRAMVASLLRSVADNVERDGAEAALASPLRRHDTDAVAKHLDAMAPHPRSVALYAAALAQVVDTLEVRKELPPEVVAAARALIAQRSR